MGKSFTIVDLFAGVGGFRKGFELASQRAGLHFSCLESADNDRYACRTYEHLYGENPTADVSSDVFKEKLESLGTYDVLCAGFPCQPFSRSGLQEGFMDTTKGTLFFDLADILKRTHPPMFLFENVDNLTSHNKGVTFSTIIHTLAEELNYHIVGVEKVLGGIWFPKGNFAVNSKHFGVPQNRPRVYIMGFSKKHYTETEILKHVPVQVPKSRRRKPIFAHLTDVLDNNVDIKYYLAEGALASMKEHRHRHMGKGNGFGYVVVNDDPERNVANAVLATGGSGKERNIVRDVQGLKFAGQQVESKKTPVNGEGLRFMTPNEWGRLQGFIGYAFMRNGDETFSFPHNISDTQKYKMFGNAVTVPVVEEMATVMMETHKLMT